MRECFRVLKPGGFATIQVPITRDRTFQDPSITGPKDRLKHYGQLDHVVAYCPDFSEQLAECGFLVPSFMARSAWTRKNGGTWISDGDERFLGRKPGGLPNRRELAASSG
jgi:hypothetical protein